MKTALVILLALFSFGCSSVDDNEADSLTTSIAMSERMESAVRAVGVFDANGNLIDLDFTKDDKTGDTGLEADLLMAYIVNNMRDWRVWGYKMGVVSEEEWLKLTGGSK